MATNTARPRHWKWTNLTSVPGVVAFAVLIIYGWTGFPPFNDAWIWPIVVFLPLNLSVTLYLSGITARIGENYPPEYVAPINKMRKQAAQSFPFLFLLTVGCILLGNIWLIFWIIAVFSGSFAFTLAVFTLDSVSRVKLAPYFEHRIPGKWHWSEIMARQCLILDEVARQAGVHPLSDFGFTDDWPGRKALTWHPPAAGLRTIAALLKVVDDHPALQEEVAELKRDLEEIEQRLREAIRADTQFCFILHWPGGNGMEIEQRKGFF